MLSTVRAAIERKGLASGIRWTFWNTFRGKYKPLAFGAVRHVPFLFLDANRLKQQARDRGRLFYYGEPKLFGVDQPVDPLPELAPLVGTYELPQPFVAAVPDGRLVGPYPLALADGKIVVEATVSPSVTLLNLFYGLRDTVEAGPRATLGRGHTHFDAAVPLYNCWNGGYYHWVVETLTRLQGVEEYRKRTGTQPTLVVGPDFGGFQRETLDLLGYGPDDWVEWDFTSATVDELVVPSVGRASSPGTVLPVEVDWLRERMRPAVRERVDLDRFSPLVYVSRKDADRRGVSNEDELFAELRERGFERYYLAEMDTAETIGLLMQADVVVGPHGAGLTDLIYADDASVVELHRGEGLNTRSYWLLSTEVGLRYRHVFAEVDGPDMRVDVDEVLGVVDEELRASAGLTAD